MYSLWLCIAAADMWTIITNCDARTRARSGNARGSRTVSVLVPRASCAEFGRIRPHSVKRALNFHALDVFSGAGVDADGFALVDEGGDLNLGPGLHGGR